VSSLKARVKKYKGKFWIFVEDQAIIRVKEVFIDGKKLEGRAELEVDKVELVEDAAYFWS